MHRQPDQARVPDWSQLLLEAVQKPGTISSAYKRFWNYSIGNQLLALFECLSRDLQPGPINTFKGWQALGRHVKKGQKAITLCMPVKVKIKTPVNAVSADAPDEGISRSGESKDEDESPTGYKTVFIYKARWFILSQTEGEPYIPAELPEWSESNALRGLQIQRIAFDHFNGNILGLARERSVAISEIAVRPLATLFHELAHVILGHTAETEMKDDARTPKSMREVEAECVALICCESLDLPGTAEGRGYVQHWLKGQVISDRSARKIFRAADVILKAGYPATSASAAE